MLEYLIYSLIGLTLVVIVALAGIILMSGMNGRRDEEDG